MHFDGAHWFRITRYRYSLKTAGFTKAGERTWRHRYPLSSAEPDILADEGETIGEPGKASGTVH